jgi:hypothetical protein
MILADITNTLKFNEIIDTEEKIKHNIIAYLDPGTGSFIIQMLIASLVGIAFFIKSFWRNIKAIIIGFFSKK